MIADFSGFEPDLYASLLLVSMKQVSLHLVQWLADRYQGPPREGSTKAGPRLYEPQGKRFTLLQGDSPSSRVFQ